MFFHAISTTTCVARLTDFPKLDRKKQNTCLFHDHMESNHYYFTMLFLTQCKNSFTKSFSPFAKEHVQLLFCFFF